jgi:ribose/xylose/arabinose/galactoside ABC-type transport system permease subunit
MDILNQVITYETMRPVLKFVLVTLGVYCLYLTKNKYGASGVACGIHQEKAKQYGANEAEIAMYRYASNSLCTQANLCAAIAAMCIFVGGAL